MAREEMCQCCKKRPVGGYIQGSGIYLERFCLYCYKKGAKNGAEHTSTGWCTTKKGGSK